MKCNGQDQQPVSSAASAWICELLLGFCFTHLFPPLFVYINQKFGELSLFTYRTVQFWQQDSKYLFVKSLMATDPSLESHV